MAVAALLLVGGGAAATWFLVHDPEVGADNPEVAVESFLHAVYRDLDPTAAASLVCSAARDEASLATKVEEIRAYQETALEPRFQWNQPTVVEQTEEITTVEVTVTLTTQDERVANQHLQVSVLDRGDRGWWVCDVTVVETPTGSDTDASEESDAEADAADDTDDSSDDNGSSNDGGE